MESITAGDLVKVATGGPELDGIVFDVPSHNKAVVAMMDSKRGPVFRTVNISDAQRAHGGGPGRRGAAPADPPDAAARALRRRAAAAGPGRAAPRTRARRRIAPPAVSRG